MQGLWAELSVIYAFCFIPRVLGTHGKFGSRAVDSDTVKFTMCEAHSDWEWKRDARGARGEARSWQSSPGDEAQSPRPSPPSTGPVHQSARADQDHHGLDAGLPSRAAAGLDPGPGWLGEAPNSP